MDAVGLLPVVATFPAASVAVTLESVPPPAGEGQQYTWSQYNRSQKSTSGGQEPGGLVHETGAGSRERLLKLIINQSAQHYVSFQITCGSRSCRRGRNLTAVTKRQNGSRKI